MVANQTYYSRFKQRSVIKFLLVEKGKPCEIYTIICDVYREVCLSQNNLNKSVKDGFATMSRKESL